MHVKVLYNLFFFLFLGEKRDFPQFSPNNLFTKFFDNVILPSGLCAAFFLAFFLAFLRRASPKQRAGASFPIPLSCRSLGCEGKKRRCIQIPIPLFARLPSAPISVARHKEKNLFRFSSGADPALPSADALILSIKSLLQYIIVLLFQKCHRPPFAPCQRFVSIMS